MTRWTKFCVRPPALYGARRSRRGLPEPSQTLKMAPKRPVTRDTVSISAKPPKCAARDGRIDRNGTVIVGKRAGANGCRGFEYGIEGGWVGEGMTGTGDKLGPYGSGWALTEMQRSSRRS